MHFIVGDIHGEYTKAKLLLDAVLRVDAHAKFIFIGDYLDKGDDPYKTVRFLDTFSKNHECIFLRGNHEYCWEIIQSNEEENAAYLLRFGGKNTIHSVDENLSVLEVRNRLMTEFSDFFKSLRNYYAMEDYVVTHSGIPPELFEQNIESLAPKQLLFNRYEFIRLKKLYFGKKVVFGHTGFFTPFYDGYKIGIDTAACFSEAQPLTAFCTDKEFFINSNNITIALSDIDQLSCPVIPRFRPWRQI